MNVPTNEISVNNLPEDSASLKAMLREVLAKLESVSADQEHEKRLAEQLRQRADDLYLENLRLQQELERYKKATYGPRADRLSMNQLAQMLLEFAEALEQKPIHLEDLRGTEPEPESSASVTICATIGSRNSSSRGGETSKVNLSLTINFMVHPPPESQSLVSRPVPL